MPAAQTRIRCPLCESCEVKVVGGVSAARLRHEYQRLGTHVETAETEEITLQRCKSCDLKFFTPIVTPEKDFYEKLQRFPWYYLEEKDEFATAAQHIHTSDEVLEIGAGRGAFAHKIAGSRYTGLELSAAAVSAARETGLELRYETVEQHAVENAGRYDVVCAFQVLEHVPETARFLRAAIDCLRTDGRLILSVPNDDGFVRLDADVLNFPPHHMTRWSVKCLQSLPSLMPVELVMVKEELLGHEHVLRYSTIVVESALRSVLGLSPRLLDTRLRSTVPRLPIRLLAGFLARGFAIESLRPRGHSVTVVFRKLSRE